MTKNLYQPVLINTALIICFVFSLYGLVVDTPLIPEEYKSFYIAGRVIVAVICAFFLFQVNVLKKQYESQVPLIYGFIILYCIHGQYFVSGYYLAFMQAVAGFSLFFPMPKKYYYPMTWIGTVFILVSVWTTIYNYSEVPEKNLKFQIDTSFGIVLISLISFIGYIKITLARTQKLVLAEKFLDVGRYFGGLVHDLKSLSSSPTVYVELLSDELLKDSPRINYLQEIVSNLKIDIYGLNEKVLGINSLSKNSDVIVPINVKSLLYSIKTLYFSRDQLDIILLGEQEAVVANEFALKSVLLNLINNSRENFRTRGIDRGIVEVLVQRQKITFRDNGGGFSKEALMKINQNSFFSEKSQGSGMGLFIVREYMSEFNGKVFIGNRTDGISGVHIDLLFGHI